MAVNGPAKNLHLISAVLLSTYLQHNNEQITGLGSVTQQTLWWIALINFVILPLISRLETFHP